MKIIFLLDSPYPFYTGGRETWINNVCNLLVNYYDIEVITHRSINPKISDGKFTNIDSRVKVFGAKNLYNCQIVRPFLRSYINYFRMWIDTFSMYLTLKQRIKESGMQSIVIISMNTVSMAKIGIMAEKKYKNVKHIASMRGKHGEVTGTYYPLLKKRILDVEINNLKKTNRIWANGFDTQEYLKERGLDSKVIFNGIDTFRIDRMKTEDLPDFYKNIYPKIITIGTLLDLKGYPQLIEAVRYLHSEFSIPIHLFAFGKGDQQRYKKMAKEAGIADFVHFMGEVRDAVAFAKGADVVAVLGSSIGAGLSMAALESLASMKPVIAWDNQCYRQLITNGENGILVPELNIKALAEGIKSLLDNPDRGLVYAVEARKSIECYDWANVVNSIREEIDCLE